MAERTTWHLEDDVLMPLADEVQRLWPGLKDEQFRYRVHLNLRCKWSKDEGFDFVVGEGVDIWVSGHLQMS